MSIWDNFVEDFNVAFRRKPGKVAEVKGPAARSAATLPTYVENLDDVPVRRKHVQKRAPKRANYDGMSFSDAFAAALRAGKSRFNWRGKDYTTELAPAQLEVPQPTIEPEPMDRSYNPADTSPKVWNDVTAAASYGADAGLRRAAMQPSTVNITGVHVPQYGWGGWLAPICHK